MRSDRGLTPKQEAFVREYLVDLNASAAYRRAGYKSGNADVCGPRLLGNAGVQVAVREEIEKRKKRTEITADFVIGGLREVAQRCMQRVPVMVGRGEDRRQATALVANPATGELREEGVWEFDSSGANRALELLGKHLGVFRDMTGDQDAPPVARVEIKVTDARKP